MSNSKILIYDGSFNGFLTAVFIAFEEKIQVSDIQKNSIRQNRLFSDTKTIFTQMNKAKRVWNAIDAKSNSFIKNIYFAYLSESKDVELLLYRYIRSLFDSKYPNLSDDSNSMLLKIRQLTNGVAKEKHRTEIFLQFRSTKDAVLFANITPDFDLLPLVSKHFRSRYADREWLVYDEKRKYGIYYDLKKVEIVSLDLNGVHTNSLVKNKINRERELGYQDLWSEFIKSTNIKSRINKKLHTRPLPKQHYSFVSEKEAV